MYVYKSVAESRVANAHHIINSALTGSRSPAGPRCLGAATRISASLLRRLSAFFGSTPDQGPKAAKYAVLTPGHAGFPNRAKRSEGSNSAPIQNAPVSACGPLCAIFLREPSVYPLSPVKANVGHLWEKLKIGMRNGWGQSCGGIFADFFSSADGEGSQRTGKCMYIKAWRNKKISLAAQSRAVAGGGKAPVSPCVPLCAIF